MALTLLLSAAPARAWLLNEHTQLTQAALEDFEYDWQAQGLLLMVRHGLRLCENPATDESGCPSLADLPAVAGDHSCLPSDLRSALAGAARDDDAWLRKILRTSAKVEAALKKAGADGNARVEIKRQMHVDLQLQDQDYLIRAVLDYAHFLQPREDPRLGTKGLLKYMQAVLASGRQANALAAYVNYHVAAVRLASQARTPGPGQQERFIHAYLTEAFALHFLQDAFAAGHFVGHWGEDGMRVGTHDYYNRYGFETTQWSSPEIGYTARGDGFLSDQEVSIIKGAVVESLKQVFAAATDAGAAAQLLASFADVYAVEQLDSCHNEWVSPGLEPAVRSTELVSVLGRLPVPSLRDPQVPRVRIEYGPFFGGAAGLHGSIYVYDWRADELSPEESVVGGRSQAALRLGYGLGGIVNDPLNAQAFADFGVIAEKRDTGRSDIGYSFRLHAPGYVFFVDGGVAVLSSVLAKATGARCPTCFSWTAAAAGGGMCRFWRSFQLTDSFAVQVSLLRDVSLHWFPGNSSKRYRVELLLPALTGRWVVPIAGGDAWSQSTDMYVDMGPSLTWGPEQPTTIGVFASTAIAGRLFP